MPNYFYTFNIIEQLSSILATTMDIHFPARSTDSSRTVSSMKDIIDGHYYRKILTQESEPILTLTMSTDGIQPSNSTEKSIWPVTFVINEIKRKKRFCYQNVILGGIWPGPAKPKRFEMAAFLDAIVVQLKELEQGFYFGCRSNAGYATRHLKVFLICACMDEPAQALAQSLPEPTAQFGYGRCEIRGKYFSSFVLAFQHEEYYLGYSVRSSRNSDHSINCFPIEDSQNQPHLRSNDRYDYLISIKESNEKQIEKFNGRLLDRKAKRRLKQKLVKNKESERGILGPCILRQLKYFDVGFSFVSDSLHNIYHGIFVSITLHVVIR